VNCLVKTIEINLLTGQKTVIKQEMVEAPTANNSIRILAEKILDYYHEGKGEKASDKRAFIRIRKRDKRNRGH
jgi:hypothetical protein